MVRPAGGHWRIARLVPVLVAAGLLVAVAWGSRAAWWPMASYLKQEAQMAWPAHRRDLDAIVARASLPRAASGFQQIVQVRHWVNAHSVHLIDAEHDAYAFHLPSLIGRLKTFSEAGGAPPHLSCGPRAYAMKAILDELGIASRVVDFFVIRQGEVLSHTLLEVFDRDHDRWVLQDPDFNVSYVHAHTRLPLSAAAVIRLSPALIDFDSEGARIENVENLAATGENYFALGVLYRLSYGGRRSIFLHPASFDVDRPSVRQGQDWIGFRQYLRARDFDPEFRLLGD